MNLYIDNSDLPTLDVNVAARVKEDRAAGNDAKIVVRGYYPDQHMHLANHGLTDQDLLNMYDVFQKATDVDPKMVHYRHNPQIDKTRYHLDGIDWGMAQARRFGTTYGRNVIDAELFAGNPGGRSSMLHYIDRLDHVAVTKRMGISQTLFFIPQLGTLLHEPHSCGNTLKASRIMNGHLFKHHWKLWTTMGSISGLRVKCMPGSTLFSTKSKSKVSFSSNLLFLA